MVPPPTTFPPYNRSASDIETPKIGGQIHLRELDSVPEKTSVWSLHGLSLRQVLRRLALRVSEDELFTRSAALSFYFIFAFFPMLLSLVVMMRTHEESLLKSRRLKVAWENKRKQASEKKLTSSSPRCPSLAPVCFCGYPRKSGVGATHV